MIFRASGSPAIGVLALAATIAAGASSLRAAAAADDPEIVRLEASASAEPENLWLGALYRQRAIQLGAYDRAIKTFDRLAARRDAGPNVFISLSLAYVDKVPTVGEFRRMFVGNDARSALTKSIAHKPSFVAYYIRGLVALFYPESIFHRGRQAVADLQQARAIAMAETPQPYHVRVFITLGDAYWKLSDAANARAVWSEGLKRFPGDKTLAERLSLPDGELDRVIRRALDSGTRIDTSLRELFPEAAPNSGGAGL